ncbi:glycosyltransferase [Pontibacter akesuensis]|uniref:glycosyltransferase n=1 Tax=Pontibacter akesuensis TaxID=388950 RepID=UPI00167395BF|nr:glycosyltransferase family 2 protein [Pontibacter akesuensis]
MCVLIPAYREDVVILESAQTALQHSYGGELDVIVIADGLKAATIAALRQKGAKVVEVSFERSTKGKALLEAMRILPPDLYEVAVVLDVDNIMGNDVLEEVNNAFEAGYKVVQCHRRAKNIDSAFALLDACNEEISNHIFRKGHFALGMSPSLIGSGMAFEFSYLKRLLADIGETVGEDKELDYRILKDREKVCYLNKIYVYDEKIENAKVFTQQRTRWMSTQLEYVKKYTLQGTAHLFRFGNVGYFDKVLQTLLLPKVLLIGCVGVFLLLSSLISFGPPAWFWGALLLALNIALLIALPRYLYNRRLLLAILHLPWALVCMCAALFRLNRTKSSFLPTPHTSKAVTSDLND